MLNIYAIIAISIFAFLIPAGLFWVYTQKVLESLLIGVIIAVGTFFTIHNFTEKKYQDRERGFANGETITTLIQRVDSGRGDVYILTEDNQTFSAVCDVKYKMLLPGDTLIYRLSTTGETRILDVKYKSNEYIQDHLRKLEAYN